MSGTLKEERSCVCSQQYLVVESVSDKYGLYIIPIGDILSIKIVDCDD
jgi:hypothetical protein